MKLKRGFSLIELLIVISIAGLLAIIGVPLYTQHITHTYRLTAESKLLQLTVALERYHVEQNTYRGATLAALHVAEVGGHYQFSIRDATDDDYVVVATPVGLQAARDRECGELSVNGLGEKHISGEGNLSTCW